MSIVCKYIHIEYSFKNFRTKIFSANNTILSQISTNYNYAVPKIPFQRLTHGFAENKTKVFYQGPLPAYYSI